MESRQMRRSGGTCVRAVVCALVLAAHTARAQTPHADAARDATGAPAGAAPPEAPPGATNGRPGGAGEGSPEVLEARASFLRGVDLATAGSWREALAAFERSNRLRPHAVTTYDVAFCEHKLGHLARALREFEAALAESTDPNGTRLPPELAEKAAAAVAEIETALATARVTIASDETQILVDGCPLAPAHSEGDAPVMLADAVGPGAPEPVPGRSFVVRLDPGTHVFRFFLRGHDAWERVIEVAPSATITIDGTPPRVETAPRNATYASLQHHSSRVFAYSSLSAGAVGLVVGSTFGVLALVKRSSLVSACGGTTCPPERAGDVRELGTFADVATAGFAIGAAGVALGTILLVTENRGADAPRSPAARRRAAIEFGPRSVDLRLSF